MKTRRAVAYAAMLALLGAAACNSRTDDSGAAVDSEKGGSARLEAIRTRLRALEKQLGEDAYDRPEVEEMLKELAAISSDSPDYTQALELMDFLRAKRRLAYVAKQAPRSPPVDAPQFGPLRMEGAPPSSKADMDRVSKIKVGSTREELVAAFGNCLVRQTWFPARPGGTTNELFHVSPDCRAQLGSKIFRVSGSKVAEMYTGNLDMLMNSDAPRHMPKDPVDPRAPKDAVLNRSGSGE